MPESLGKSQKMTENALLLQVKDKIGHLAQQMAQNRIKTDLKMENIGISPEGEPKVFIGLDF